MSEEKIYHVLFSVDLVLQAASLEDAITKARKAWGEAESQGSLQPDMDSIERVERCSDLPFGWNGKCLPFLGDGKRRLEELLEQ